MGEPICPATEDKNEGAFLLLAEEEDSRRGQSSRPQQIDTEGVFPVTRFKVPEREAILSEPAPAVRLHDQPVRNVLRK